MGKIIRCCNLCYKFLLCVLLLAIFCSYIALIVFSAFAVQEYGKEIDTKQHHNLKNSEYKIGGLVMGVLMSMTLKILSMITAFRNKNKTGDTCFMCCMFAFVCGIPLAICGGCLAYKTIFNEWFCKHLDSNTYIVFAVLLGLVAIVSTFTVAITLFILISPLYWIIMCIYLFFKNGNLDFRYRDPLSLSIMIYIIFGYISLFAISCFSTHKYRKQYNENFLNDLNCNELRPVHMELCCFGSIVLIFICFITWCHTLQFRIISCILLLKNSESKQIEQAQSTQSAKPIRTGLSTSEYYYLFWYFMCVFNIICGMGIFN